MRKSVISFRENFRCQCVYYSYQACGKKIFFFSYTINANWKVTDPLKSLGSETIQGGTGVYPFLKFSGHHFLGLSTYFCEKSRELFCILQIYSSVFVLGDEEGGDFVEVEVPKVLGDLFEAVAGALYVDCGEDVAKVWEIYLPILKPSIGELTTKFSLAILRGIWNKLFQENL